ncbi:glycoside hydrolase family 2 TIM barrel-domain containing protein [uncultured Draconibacterium sp.]|uniref:glycoside hydrolase family 2 TIM barrel-domain containing protein n=1 Tax=uncultured Draconibacterium sp. TaxID=1573823 RepID=UPI0029C72171|nr:glycoside hydrolase family 2 TIM barrel-domain containing protein [uncultured Draconibacterium sp.]
MSFKISLILLLLLGLGCQRNEQITRSELIFDENWKFHRGDVEGAELVNFSDQGWRIVDLPHDWSIEPLPGQDSENVIGPFSKESIGKTATGYTIGGTGWYRKTFTLDSSNKYSKMLINFDGVYMNADVWINGEFLGNHPYGYTAFQFDITKFLNPAGEENVLAVKVKNEGENSRWYSGSGICRHVSLIRKQAIHLKHNGVFITTESVSDKGSRVKIASDIELADATPDEVSLSVKVTDPLGNIAADTEVDLNVLPQSKDGYYFSLSLPSKYLWSIEQPNLHTAEITVLRNGKAVDRLTETFGIRTINFDAQTGFTLNGKTVLIKGGNMHHDNGFLGAATIDRAEERRVELMKANGFNAIRTAHNPPSKPFLDACDRLGMLVMDEAFDQWVRPKNPQDYNLYFKDWWQKDLTSMILRDRNHPSVIFWSIGNEINERADSLGYAIRKQLVSFVHELDSTRPVTEGICSFWDHWGQEWKTTAPAFAELDVGGYNYLNNQYEKDHEEYPERIMAGTESYAMEAYNFWKQVEKLPYVIGDFVWTAMDYLGETGLGRASLESGPRVGLEPWPYFNAFCGDIDLCGFKKPQSYFRDVVWDISPIEMMVHTPIPEGKKETVSYWGWPDELPSWNWENYEDISMDVRVFTKAPLVRLELNGKVIGKKEAGEKNGLIAHFKVPYKAGKLKAVAIKDGEEVAAKVLKTTGVPSKVRLTADRTKIKANRNDLSYVKVEITDADGNLIPNAVIPLTFFVEGVGEIAGSGSASPTDMESFNSRNCKTFQGKALVILRPLMEKKIGDVTLSAQAPGLESDSIVVSIQ